MLKIGLQMKKYFRALLLILILILAISGLNAGPPYFTDDPDPVKFHHWEFYLATQDVFDARNSTSAGSLPQVEVNYGFTIGGSLNFTEHLHLIFSGGHSIVNENLATAYVGLYITY